jgi:hypothetical protein
MPLPRESACGIQSARFEAAAGSVAAFAHTGVHQALHLSRQPAKVTLLHTDVRMLRAQDAQEQPFAGGNEATV